MVRRGPSDQVSPIQSSQLRSSSITKSWSNYFGSFPPLLKERAGVRSKPAIPKPLTIQTPILNFPFSLRKKRGAEAPRQTKTTLMRKFPFMKLLLLPADKQSRSVLNLHHALPSFDQRLLKMLHRVYPHRCG